MSEGRRFWAGVISAIAGGTAAGIASGNLAVGILVLISIFEAIIVIAANRPSV